MFNQIKNKLFKINNLWWLSVFIILVFFHSSHDLNNDEGIILNGAWNLLNGREIYFDFFEFIPPGSFYFIYFFWKIFGAHFFIAKLISILAVFAGAIGAAKISRELTESSFSNLAAIPFIVSSFFIPIINHNTFSTIIIIWAIYFFVKALGQNNYKYYLISGALSGTAIIFLHQKAFALIGACGIFFLVWLIKEKRLLTLKKALVYFLGTALPVIAVFIKWPPMMLFNNLIAYPLNNYLKVKTDPIYLLAFFVLVLVSVAWIYRKKGGRKFWFLVLAQFFLLLSAYPNPDLAHVILAGFILFSFFPIILNFVIEKRKNPQVLFVLFLYIIVFAIIIKNAAVFIYYFPPLYTLKYSPAIEFINKNCQDSDYIYAGPFMPGMYFETRKLNPTPFHILSSNFQTVEDFNIARRRLEEYKPACAVLNYNTTKKWEHNINNPVDEFIRDNYVPVYRRDGDDKVVLKLISR